MKVQRLDDSVINQIKYHLHFNTIDSIVETILQRCSSLKASTITIKIDLQAVAVFIQSNDVGYTPNELEELAVGGNFGGLEVVSNIKVISKFKEFKCPYTITVGRSPIAQLCDEPDSKNSYCKPEPIGKHGTIYMVSNIFSNLPVRQAQLKSTPMYKVINNVKLALLQVLYKRSQIQVSLQLYNPQKFQFEEMSTTNAASHTKLLQDLFEIDVQFKPVKATFKTYQIEGIIGLQRINTRNHQFVFVNNKLMTLTRTEIAGFSDVFENFGDLDPSPKKKMLRKYPTYLISITCDKDVTECSYSWRVILDILKRIFIKFVRLGQLKQSTNEVDDNNEFQLLPSPKRAKTDKFILNTNVRWGDVNRREIEGMVSCGKSLSLKPQVQPPTTKIAHDCCHHHQPECELNEYEHIQFDKLHLTKYRIIKQIDKKFILLIINSKLVILDQHAADERVKVEQLMREFVYNMPRNLRLVQPLRIKVSSSEHLLLQQHLAQFKSLGIIYYLGKEKKDNDLIITNVPELLIPSCNDGPFIKSLLMQHCFDLQNNIKNQIVNATIANDGDWLIVMHHTPQFIINMINSRACRSAIMFGDELTMQEMHQLIDDLSKCKLPFQCAHGRPSIVPLVNLRNNE